MSSTVTDLTQYRLKEISTKIRSMAGRRATRFAVWPEIEDVMVRHCVSILDLKEALIKCSPDAEEQFGAMRRYWVTGVDFDERKLHVLLTFDDECSKIEVIDLVVEG